MEIRKVRVAHVQAVLDAMTKAGKAARTVSHCRAALSSMFKHALLMQIITSNPVRDSEGPKKKRPELTSPSADDLNLLIKAAADTAWAIPVLLTCKTAARRGEVCALRWQDVDLDGETAEITSTIQKDQTTRALVRLDPKTERGTRQVPLLDAVGPLRQHRAEQRERLLALGVRVTSETPVCDDGTGGLLDPDDYSKAWKGISAAAGVPGVRLHDARHGVAKAFAKKGIRTEVISKVLGHSDEAFTMRTYIKVDNDDLRDAAGDMRDALSG
jgi:integrase